MLIFFWLLPHYFSRKRTCHWRHNIVLNFSLVYHATLKFLICIYLLFLDLGNTYVTGLCYPGNQQICISKLIGSFIISLYCHTLTICLSDSSRFCHTHQFVNIWFAFYILFCSLFFELPLTRGLLDLFYIFQISLG